MSNITETQPTEVQINQWKRKAEQWDKLGEEISKCYVKKNPEFTGNDEESEEFIENNDENVDLTTIGELAATAFGWL